MPDEPRHPVVDDEPRTSEQVEELWSGTRLGDVQGEPTGNFVRVLLE
jgi:hypothetical protein